MATSKIQSMQAGMQMGQQMVEPIAAFIRETPERDKLAIEEIKKVMAMTTPEQRVKMQRGLENMPRWQRIRERNAAFFDEEGGLILPDTSMKDRMSKFMGELGYNNPEVAEEFMLNGKVSDETLEAMNMVKAGKVRNIAEGKAALRTKTYNDEAMKAYNTETGRLTAKRNIELETDASNYVSDQGTLNADVYSPKVIIDESEMDDIGKALTQKRIELYDSQLERIRKDQADLEAMRKSIDAGGSTPTITKDMTKDEQFLTLLSSMMSGQAASDYKNVEPADVAFWYNPGTRETSSTKKADWVPVTYETYVKIKQDAITSQQAGIRKQQKDIEDVFFPYIQMAFSPAVLAKPEMKAATIKLYGQPIMDKYEAAPDDNTRNKILLQILEQELKKIDVRHTR